MLVELREIPDIVRIIIVYVRNDLVLQEILQNISKNYTIDSSYVIDMEQEVSMHAAYKDALLRPLVGDKWLLRIDLDKVPLDSVIREMTGVNRNSITVMYTRMYNTYSKLVSLDRVKNNRDTIKTVYGGSLSSKDMYVLHQENVNAGAYSLPSATLNYVVRQYRHDGDKFFKLLQILRTGEPIKTRAEVVNAVGLGAITIERMLITVLKHEGSTERGRKSTLNHWMQMLYDLQQVFSPMVIVQQMQVLLNDVLNLKLLQSQGFVIGNRREIPKEYETRGLLRLSKYEDDIFGSISVPKVLWVQSILNLPEFKYNPEQQIIYLFLKTLSLDIK